MVYDTLLLKKNSLILLVAVYSNNASPPANLKSQTKLSSYTYFLGIQNQGTSLL